MTKEELEKRLDAAGTRPNKIRGQNFLIDEDDLNFITSIVEDKNNVLEIGPGVGNLTDKLLGKNKKITAVEIDPSFSQYLSQKYGDTVHVVHSDILHFDESVMAHPYCVVGNIPYYITGKILRKFLESKKAPEKIVLTVQKEVAERICANAPQASFISNVVQLFGEAKVARVIPKSHFWPEPKVDSAVLLIKPRGEVAELKKDLIVFIKSGFAQPRKTLKNNLKNALGVDNTSLDDFFRARKFSETVRPHEITLDDWKDLFSSFGTKKEFDNER